MGVIKLRFKKFENKSIIRNAKIINENEFIGDIANKDYFISEISKQSISGTFNNEYDAIGLMAIPGMIDDQVHFRAWTNSQSRKYFQNLELL